MTRTYIAIFFAVFAVHAQAQSLRELGPTELMRIPTQELNSLSQKWFGQNGECRNSENAVRCAHFKSFLHVRKKWEACLLDDSVLKKTGAERILSLLAKQTESQSNCAYAGSLLQRNLESLVVPVALESLTFMQDKVLAKALDITISTLARSSKEFTGRSIQLSELLAERHRVPNSHLPVMRATVMAEIEEGCGRNGKRCTSIAGARAANLIKTVEAENIPRVSFSQVAEHLNGEISALNQRVVNVRAPVERGIIRDGPAINAASTQAYDAYSRGFDQTLASRYGALLVSPPLSDTFGTFRLIESASWSRWFRNGMRNDFHKDSGGNQYVLSPHGNLPAESGEGIVSESATHYLNNLKNQAKDQIRRVDAVRNFNEMESANSIVKANLARENLADLALVNPIAVAHFLAEHPEYADIYCDILKGIARTQRNEELFKTGMIWVAGVAGTVAVGTLVAGAGVGLGGVFLASQAARGVAQGIMIVSSSAGTVSTIASAGVTASSNQEGRRAERRVESFRAGNASSEAVREYEVERNHIQQNIEATATDAATTLLSLGLGRALRTLKPGATNLSNIKRASNVARRLQGSKNLEELTRGMSTIEADNLLEFLGRRGNGEFIRNLRNNQYTSAELGRLKGVLRQCSR